MDKHETLVPYIKELVSFESLHSTSKPPPAICTGILILNYYQQSHSHLYASGDSPSGCHQPLTGPANSANIIFVHSRTVLVSKIDIVKHILGARAQVKMNNK